MQAIFLVDSLSRINSSIDLAELKRFDIHIISDLKEITSLEYKGIPVIILDGFVQSENGMTELILYKELLGLEYIFLSNNEILLKQLEEYAKVFSFNTEQINYSMLMSVINDDKEASKQFISEPDDKFQKIAKMVSENPALADDNLREMSTALLNLIDANKRVSSSKDDLKERFEEVSALNRNKESQLQFLGKYVDDLMKQTIKVNKSLKDYSFLCQKNIYDKVNLENFKNKPNIIYFKEYGEFLHLDTFIQTLAEVMKIQFDLPTKVLWIMDKNNPIRLSYIPEYYTIFSDGVYTKPLIHISDYMCTTGGYEEIMRVLCDNQSFTSNLIIVDSKLVNDTILFSSDILKIDLCRSKSKIRAYSLFSDRTVTNGNDEGEMEWGHYYDYETLEEEDRFLFLSNRPVIKNITDIIHKTFDSL